METLPGILAEQPERAEKVRELRVVDAAVALFAGDELEQGKQMIIRGLTVVWHRN